MESLLCTRARDTFENLKCAHNHLAKLAQSPRFLHASLENPITEGPSSRNRTTTGHAGYPRCVLVRREVRFNLQRPICVGLCKRQSVQTSAMASSKLKEHPAAIVYQSRRNESDGLDSTARTVLKLQLSRAAQDALELLFIQRSSTEASLPSCFGGPPETDHNTTEKTKRRDAILQETLKTCILVDIVSFDFGPVTQYVGGSAESDNIVTLTSDALISVVAPPSVDISPDMATPGLIKLSVLPRSLPISSTHSGRPFRLLVHIRIPDSRLPRVPAAASKATGAGASRVHAAAAEGDKGKLVIDEVLVTTPFHVLAKEPSRVSTCGPRPRGAPSKKARLHGNVDSTQHEDVRTDSLRLPSAACGATAAAPVLSQREKQLLTAIELAVRTNAASQAEGAAHTLLYSDLSRVATARLLQAGLLPALGAAPGASAAATDGGSLPRLQIVGTESSAGAVPALLTDTSPALSAASSSANQSIVRATRSAFQRVQPSHGSQGRAKGRVGKECTYVPVSSSTPHSHRSSLADGSQVSTACDTEQQGSTTTTAAGSKRSRMESFSTAGSEGGGTSADTHSDAYSYEPTTVPWVRATAGTTAPTQHPFHKPGQHVPPLQAVGAVAQLPFGMSMDSARESGFLLPSSSPFACPFVMPQALQSHHSHHPTGTEAMDLPGSGLGMWSADFIGVDIGQEAW